MVVGIFEFMGNFVKGNWGGYYDPPFKCRVPKLNFMWSYPYSPKGFSHFLLERHLSDIFGENG